MNHRALLFLTIGIVVGCSGSSASDATNGIVIPPPSGQADDSGTVPDAPSVRPNTPKILGSPLCNAATWMGCYPDDERVFPKDCDLPPDAGIPDATGWDTVPLACHVQRAANDAGVAPVCTAAGNLTESDPEHCFNPTDCAAGYECVSGASLSLQSAGGRCQPYCCAGDCSRQGDFCDIEPMYNDPSLRVPVCMSIQSCGLLDSPGDSCPSGQTCAIVRDNSATSCVAIGPRQAGEECNTDHCARGLVCLGTPGERSCYILCHTALHGAECASTPKQLCKGGIGLSPIPGIGICQ